jgi:SAM-dependent methyltransferase
MSLRRLARNWNAFAADDAMWSILTWADKRGNRWQPDEFFATGQSEIADVLSRARAFHPGLATGRALDFGCGVGRLSRALAAEFEEVHGVDLAANMIEAARRFDPDGAVTFHVNETSGLELFPDEHFDLIYSSITLQHMSPDLMRGYLAEFARVLRRGGVLVFQLPEVPRRRPNPNRIVHFVGRTSSRVLHSLKTMLSRRPTMDMHGMSRTEVAAILQCHGCAEPRAESSTLAGEDWVSWLYFTSKL